MIIVLTRVFCLSCLLSCCGCVGDIYGLHPVEPPAFGFVEYPTVTSLTPTLRWECFPRPHDRRAIGVPESARITNVSYEVRLTQPPEPGSDPGKVPESERVLGVAGLHEPCWTTPRLRPGGQYSWTFRARFELDGQPRVTPWSQMMGTNESPVYSPQELTGFRFHTPG